jgi:predicted DNA-binding protein (UPF0251 family)
MPATAPTPVQHNQTFTYDELCAEAKRALDASDYTQQDMADRLDVNRVSVAKAVTQPGPKFQNLQMQIIEALTDYRMQREETVRFRAHRKDGIRS